MNRVKTWHIFVVIVMAVSVFFVVKVAFGDEGNQKLSREEQMQIMKECRVDAREIFTYGPNISRVAVAFFQYRTRDR